MKTTAKRFFAALALVALTVTGLVLPDSPRAAAAPPNTAVNLSVETTATSVSDYTTLIDYNVKVATSVDVADGSVLEIVLPAELRVPQTGGYQTTATAAMVSAPVYNELTRTFEITLKARNQGSVYTFNFKAQASNFLKSTDKFVIEAMYSGESNAVAFDNLAQSQPLTVDPALASSEVQVGDYTVPDIEITVAQAGGAYGFWQLDKKAAATSDGSFHNLVIRTRYSDGTVPQSWVSIYEPPRCVVDCGYAKKDSTVPAGTDRTYSGSVNGKTAHMQLGVTWGVPLTAAIGSYSSPYDVINVKRDGTEEVIGTGQLKFEVKERSSALKSFKVVKGVSQPVVYTQGAPTGYQKTTSYHWQNNFVTGGSTISNLQQVIETPQHFHPDKVVSSIAGRITKVEYTTTNTARSWTNVAPEVSTNIQTAEYVLPNSAISAVRVTFANSTGIGFTDTNVIKYSVNTTSAATGKIYISSTNFDDSIEGSITIPAAEMEKESEVTVNLVSSFPSTPKPSKLYMLQKEYQSTNHFNSSFYNGSKIHAEFSMRAHSGDIPLKNPFIYVIVPNDMNVEVVNIFQDYIDPAKNGGVFIDNAINPTTAYEFEFTKPIDYKTLPKPRKEIQLPFGKAYLWSADGIELNGSRGNPAKNTSDIFHQLYTHLNFEAQTMVAGQYSVQIGMGGNTDDNEHVLDPANANGYQRTTRNQHPAKAYGDYRNSKTELDQFFSDAGITEQTVYTKALPFEILGSQDISLTSSTVQGSEDPAPVPISHTATGRPGTPVKYEMVLENNGSTYENLQIINALPHVGDSQLISGKPLNSKYDLAYGSTGLPKATLNDKPINYQIHVSNSFTPPRWDHSGNPVPGTPAGPQSDWKVAGTDMTGAKSFKLSLAPGQKFKPGDKLKISFESYIPANAPRTGVSANNHIIYRTEANSGTQISAAEPNLGRVALDPAASIFEISGEATNTSGAKLKAGLEMQLFKENPVTHLLEDTGKRSALDPTSRYSFIGIDAGSYAVKAVQQTGYQTTINPTSIDNNGYIKYVNRGAASNSANGYDVSNAFKTGDTKFIINDTGAIPPKWLKDLNITADVKTEVKGIVTFLDKTGTAVADSSASPYIENKLEAHLQTFPGGSPVANVAIDAALGFNLGHLNLAPGEYTILIKDVSGHTSGITSADPTFQNSNWDTTVNSLKYTITGTGEKIDANIKLTDTTPPTNTAPTLDKTFNPATVTAHATDAQTGVHKYAYKITGPSSYLHEHEQASASYTLPALTQEGAYTVETIAYDLADNESTAETVNFTVDKTPPAITFTTNPVTHAKGSPTIPATDAQWISLFGVQATDPSGIASIETDAAAFLPNTIGTYQILFRATDNAGNRSSWQPATITVSYITDPVASLTVSEKIFELCTPTHPTNDDELRTYFGYSETVAPGSTVDTATRKVTHSINWNQMNNFTVQFSFKDSEGNPSNIATGTLRVQDNTAPTITSTTADHTWKRNTPKPVTESEWLALWGINVWDCAGPALITLNTSQVDFTKSGTYQVGILAEDSSGNASYLTRNFTVNFPGDPVVSFTTNPRAHEFGQPKPTNWNTFFGYNATFATGETQKTLTIDDSGVQIATEGVWPVKYTLTDTANTTVTATAYVQIRDTTKPVINPPLTPILKHAATNPGWSEADYATNFGLHAVDPAGTGVNTASWKITEGTVNWGTAGTYPIKMTVKDNAQAPNESNPIDLKIQIQEPAKATPFTVELSENETVTVDITPHITTSTGQTLHALTSADLKPQGGGSVTVASPTTFKYTPATGFTGEEAVEITITDDLGQKTTFNAKFKTYSPIKLIKPIKKSVRTDSHTTIKWNEILASVTGINPTYDSLDIPLGMRGTVKENAGNITYKTDRSAWAGKIKYSIVMKDKLANTVKIPVEITILNPVMTLNRIDGIAGETQFQANFKHLAENEKYTLELRSTPIELKRFTGGQDGTYSYTFKIPENTAPGLHHVVLVNGDGNDRLSQAVHVSAPPKPANSDTNLVNTGSHPQTPLTAAALLALGAAAALMSRRKTKHVN